MRELQSILQNLGIKKRIFSFKDTSIFHLLYLQFLKL